MRVAIEALGIHYYGGGRSATLNLLEALFALDTETDYLVFLTEYEPALETPAGNVEQHVVPFKNRFALRLWAQAALPFHARDYDIVHFIKNLSVFGIPAKTVVTVYDLTTLIYPDLFPSFDVWYWRYVQKQSLRQADHIIAISENTAGDITQFYDIRRDSIRVIYPACAPHFTPAPAGEIARVRKKYSLPDSYIVHVGRLDRKKNLPTLVEAFALARDRTKFEGKLVLVGEEYSKSRDPAIYETIKQLDITEEVVFTGAVPDTDVPALYSGAMVAALPSLHEGFGIAALEAMACGTPLVTAPAGAVVEVVGDAAVVVESGRPEAFADALITVIENPDERATLRRRGLERRRAFSWQQAARATRRLYRELVSGSASPGSPSSEANVVKKRTRDTSL